MMKTVDEIREGFLSFFEKKHNSTRVKSASLVPDNPTLLLTSAGMVQFVPYYLGIETPPYNPPRATTCQKCARAGGKDSDIENVGRTPRHHTFFEMLGNFAWGDYYKKEAIVWAWEFVTSKEYLGLDKNRLWATVFETDDEAFEIWKNETDIDPTHILRKGKKDNFWGPPGPTGSCGPCSEIHYDLGEHLKCSDNCSIATCECDRWVEIWNMVFTELFQDEEGNQTPLDKKNVDTGMGLERTAMVCQGVESTFETDVLKHILDKVCAISGKEYKKDEKTDVSLRIVTDHARCVSFMIADGIMPSNEGRGYVLRMILRRALRHGYLLGLSLPFLEPVIDTVIERYSAQYPELKEHEAKIKETILKEEERFKLTLDKGYQLIEDLIVRAQAAHSGVFPGEDAFKLYDTYGFPFELTMEIAKESGLEVDEKGFKSAMQEQKERARASMQKVVITNDLNYINNPNTEFVGYDNTESQAKVLAIVDEDGKNVESAKEGIFDIILDKTPFYGECGGQTGDSGYLFVKNEKVEVVKTFKVQEIFVHRAIVREHPITVGDDVLAKIDTERRSEITKHHSLAHLLQAALQKVLGKNVHQAGSQVEADKTRYDFTYDKAMTTEEIKKVQEIINNWIKKGLTRKTEVMSLDEANKTGAMALFGEKYGDSVRVVSFSNKDICYSKELCAGCHVDNTKDLRLAKIVSESASSAGVRRIEIVCSDAAFDLLEAKADELDNLSLVNKVPTDKIQEKIDKLSAEVKELTSKLGDMEAQRAKDSFNTFLSRVVEAGDSKLLITKTDDFAPNAIRLGIELLSKKLGKSVVVLCSLKHDKTVFITVKVSDDLTDKIQAGKIVSELAKALGGNGGGKPQMAQGLGKTQDGIDDILLKLQEELTSKLS